MAGIPFIYWRARNPQKGIRLSLLANDFAEKDGGKVTFKGFLFGGFINYSGDVTGAEIAGIVNGCNGDLSGLSIGAVNYAKRNGRCAFQIGAINYISEYDDKGTVVQIGVYNQAGNQSTPLLNIRRKGKSIEGKTELSE